MSEIIKRCKKLAFYGVPSENDGYTYHRMKGFDEITTVKNPKEYTRQYIDEEFEQTDVVGYTPSITFGFDRFADDPVHTDLMGIFDGELVGADAVRPIVMVDLADGKNSAILRDFAVIAENEGNGMEAYKYSGSFRVKGEKTFGTAVSHDDWQTCTFTAE